MICDYCETMLTEKESAIVEIENDSEFLIRCFICRFCGDKNIHSIAGKFHDV